MNNVPSPFLVFPLAGLCSGLLSGLSGFPLVIIVPGVLFGAAIGHAFHLSVSPLSPGQRVMLIVASTVGYISAIVAGGLSGRLPDFGSDFLEYLYRGTIGGGVGALVVACSLAAVIRELSSLHTLYVVTFTGAVSGACVVVCIGTMADYSATEVLFAFLGFFSLWQTGVAWVMPTCLYCPHSSVARHNQTRGEQR